MTNTYVDFIEIPAPSISHTFYRKKHTDPPHYKYERFVKPKAIRQWAVFPILNQNDLRTVFIKTFADRLYAFLTARGTILDPPSVMKNYDNVKVTNFETTFEQELLGGIWSHIRSMLVIRSDKLEISELLKYCANKSDNVRIMELTANEASALLQSDKLMDEFAHRFQLHHGGVSHDVHVEIPNKSLKVIKEGKLYYVYLLDTDDTMVMSFSLRVGRKVPTVLGWSSMNCSDHHQRIEGHYQYLEKDDYEAVYQYMAKMVGQQYRFFTKNRSQPAKHLVIYLDEFFEDEKEDKVVMIKEIMEAFDDSNVDKPKITVISNSVLYHQEWNFNQNEEDGVVIEKGSPAFDEPIKVNTHFYLGETHDAHKYSVLHNDSEMGLERLMYVTNGMRYTHHIFGNKLPAPIEVSQRLADEAVSNAELHTIRNKKKGALTAEDANRFISFTHGRLH